MFLEVEVRSSRNFFKKFKRKKGLLLTHPKMTRFHITLPQSVNFVIKCLKIMKGGEIFIPKIPSFRTIDLIKAINNNKKPKIIGIRPGEKLHEEMVTASDALNTLEYSDYFCILSQFNKLKLNQKKRNIIQKFVLKILLT